MSTDDKGLFSCFGIVLVAVALLALGGYILSVLWGWFIVPLGIQDISIAHAIGISTIVGYLTASRKAPDDSDVLKKVLYGVFYSLFALGTGWAVHLFM